MITANYDQIHASYVTEVALSRRYIALMRKYIDDPGTPCLFLDELVAAQKALLDHQKVQIELGIM